MSPLLENMNTPLLIYYKNKYDPIEYNQLYVDGRLVHKEPTEDIYCSLFEIGWVVWG